MIQDLFKDRFAGNTQAYGTDDGYAKRGIVTPELIRRHLEGVEPIGIYPIRHTPSGPMVHWGCCDIDTGDWAEAYALATALRGMGMRPVVERSRSKGWHIWIFLKDEEWVAAAAMRRALKMAYKAIDLPAKEANPKSEMLRPEQLGNFVRLPYKGGLVQDPIRQVVMSGWNATSDGWCVSLREFLDEDVSTETERIGYWAAKWYEPPRRVVDIDTEAPADVEAIISKLAPKTQELARVGPPRDRSEGMVALAYQMANQRFSATEAFAVLGWCDMTWGKQYTSRPGGEGYLMDIIERAYS
jgi:hypothetical protein